ncbi:MAG: helical backbone metal receptor [Bacteroides sp.]|nr:helical backbone metal receptor [Bacteroides sp.]
MINIKKILCCFLTAVVLTTFSACKREEEQPTVETETTTAEAEPEPYPITINDVEIAAKPERVVCLSPAIGEIIFEMGYGASVIGRSGYCQYPEEILSARNVGSTANPDINAITDLMPNLVITSTPIASKDIFTMEQAGIATLIIPAPTTLEGFASVYNALGLIYEGMFTGIERGEEAYSGISKLLGNTEAVNIGKFVYVTENLSVAGGNTFESAVLSCFGTNAAKEGTGYGYDKQQLLDTPPDVILLNSKYSRADLLEDEVLSQLDAVINYHIIYIDNIFFERPTARLSELINTLLADYKKLGDDVTME